RCVPMVLSVKVIYEIENALALREAPPRDMPKLLHVKFLLSEQDGAGRQDGDSVADARPIVAGPIRIDPVRRHNDQIDAIFNRIVNNFFAAVSVNDRLVDLQFFRNEPLGKFLQSLVALISSRW